MCVSVCAQSCKQNVDLRFIIWQPVSVDNRCQNEISHGVGKRQRQYCLYTYINSCESDVRKDEMCPRSCDLRIKTIRPHSSNFYIRTFYRRSAIFFVALDMTRSSLPMTQSSENDGSAKAIYKGQ